QQEVARLLPIQAHVLHSDIRPVTENRILEAASLPPFALPNAGVSMFVNRTPQIALGNPQPRKKEAHVRRRTRRIPAYLINPLFAGHPLEPDLPTRVIGNLPVPKLKKLDVIVESGVMETIDVIVRVEGALLRGRLVGVLIDHHLVLPLGVPPDVVAQIYSTN